MDTGKVHRQAEAIHIDVARYISNVLEHKAYSEQAYKPCSGILNFAGRVGTHRSTDACRWADNLVQYSYPVIEEILKKRLDQLQVKDEQTEIPPHDNIRARNIISSKL